MFTTTKLQLARTLGDGAERAPPGDFAAPYNLAHLNPNV